MVPRTVDISMPRVAVPSEVSTAEVRLSMANGWVNHFRVKPDQLMLNLPWVSLKP